jgi:nucleotide-binding universal stress UspA family protein
MLQLQDTSEPPAEIHSSCPRLYKRILVGYDGSDSSERALQAGRGLALKSKGDLYVAAVECLPDSGSDNAFQVFVTAILRRHEENLYRLRIAGLNDGLRIDTFIALGDPATYLMRKARRIRASLLILAADFGVAEQQVDPVCARVVRDATCPVLVTP